MLFSTVAVPTYSPTNSVGGLPNALLRAAVLLSAVTWHFDSSWITQTYMSNKSFSILHYGGWKLWKIKRTCQLPSKLTNDLEKKLPRRAPFSHSTCALGCTTPDTTGEDPVFIDSLFFLPHPGACGILVRWSGLEPMPSALQGEVLTTGPPGKSLSTILTFWKHGLFTITFNFLSTASKYHLSWPQNKSSILPLNIAP